MNVEVRPVTPETAGDLERFSRSNGKFRYCSCMRWRMTSSQYRASSKDDRIANLDHRAHAGEPIGVLAYLDGEPVGWCSVAPRESYAALERYRALARVDDEAVWSVVCFFVNSGARRHGVTAALLRGAVRLAVASGAQVVEGYPVKPGPQLYTFMGSPATFEEAGFVDVTPQGRTRKVMRYRAT